MDTATAVPLPQIVFEDGLGQRRHIVGAGNQVLALLILDRDLTGQPLFEIALRERIDRLAGFKHPAFARVRGIAHLPKTPSTIALASEDVPGERLSQLLAIADRRLIPLEIDGALGLLRQVVSAVAAFHEFSPEAAHGALSPERLIITPDARVVVVEHVLGGALRDVPLSRERYWRQFRVAVPDTGPRAQLDQRTDVTQLGALALALILGRPLSDTEYPDRIPDIVAGVRAISTTGLEPLAPVLQSWLRRALQLDGEQSFVDAIEANRELARVVGDQDRERRTFASFLMQCEAAGVPTPVAVPLPKPEPVAIESPITPTPVPAIVAKEPEPVVPVRPSPIWGASEERVEPTPMWKRKPFIAAAVIVVAALGGYTFRGGLFASAEPAGTPVIASQPVALDAVPVAPAAPPVQEAAAPAPVPVTTPVAVEAAPPVAPVAAPEASAANLPVAGWIAIVAPVPVEIYEGDRFVGSSRSDRIMVPAGRHELAIVEESLGYRASRVVQVQAGSVSTIRLDWPRGTMALNATPWAEVWVDGQRVGETPLGRVEVPIGSHQVLFRHPQLGDQTHSVVVTANTPARVTADMRGR